MPYELVETEFKDVVLGSVFYDPEHGSRFQKIDQPINDSENKHRNESNVFGEIGTFFFKPDRKVKVPKFI